MFTVARQLRDIDRTLTRSTAQAAAMWTRLSQCPAGPDDDHWAVLLAVLRAVSGVIADQDRLLDARLELTP